jgi:DNA mismatch repair protein MutL
MAIRVLPPEVVARIAAGEVVTSPAAVVKELIENALDAGATRVEVEIRRGGVDLIRVKDDGAGIPAGEVRLAFQRHATSKLAVGRQPTVADLGRIVSLGFRGEALAAIAQAADVTLLTRTRSDPAGRFIRVAAGNVLEEADRPAAPGTVVTVRNLFAHLPARRRFLRDPRVEAAEVGQVVGRFALGYPEVEFKFLSEGRLRLHTPGDGQTRSAVAEVWGDSVARQLIEAGRVVEPGRLAITGLVGPPGLHRPTRNELAVFVNRRWVQNRRLYAAFEAAYVGVIPAGRHPVGVINLLLDPAEVDVNVHPAKLEVRFVYENEVLTAVRQTVREALKAQGYVPDLELAGAGDGAQLAFGLEPAPAYPEGPGRLPRLRVIGQFEGKFILAEGPDGLYVFDQHVVHERVLYDAFRRALAGGQVETQGLLDPVPVELTAQESPLLAAADARTRLEAAGFIFENFGPDAVLLRGVPALFAGAAEPASLFKEAVAALSAEDSVGGSWEHRLAARLACRRAVKAGDPLTERDMQDLIDRLESAELVSTCPHGRHVFRRLPSQYLASAFGRA